MALVLIGFMGAGKSTLARRLGGVDTDDLLEARIGEPIQTLFDREGEAEMRRLEAEVVTEALASGAPVVALGGGALEAGPDLSGHTVAWLDVELDTAWERVSGAPGRPLARDRDAFAARFAARRATYEAAAGIVVLPGADVGEVVPAGRAILSPVHPVFFGERPAPEPGDFILSDEHVGPLHAPEAFCIPAGEATKTLATAETVWREMARRGVTRSGRVVAVGGGVVGDIGGFCAAAYQRGIPVVHVPTTLVAQVDSAYGGKTGVDLPEAKNYVGAYHQPQAVHVDPRLLATLPAAERAAGYAEVLKTALIAGGALWERVRAGAVDDEDVVFLCATTKLRIVGADERDGGLRQVLNLGHTVGHAIETVTGYGRYRHGEAVGLGLLAALRLSGQDALRDEVAGLLAAQGLPVALEGAATDAVVDATRRDKKRLGGHTPFVLVEAVGRVTPGHAVADDELRAAVTELAAA